MPPFSVVPSFLKIISTLRSGLTKWINKHTFNYNQNPSQLTSRIHALIFPWIHKGFISPESLIFFQNLHIPLWLRKSFKFIALGLLANTFASQKIESVHFYSCPQAKFSQVFIINQTEGNYPFLSNSVFRRSPQAERGWVGRFGVVRIL